MKRVLAIFFLVTFPLIAAKTGTIRGVITDAVSGKPVSRASIEVQGTNLKTSTNSKGVFLLKSIPAGSVSLKISAKGYETLHSANVKVRYGRTARIRLELNPDVKPSNWKSKSTHGIEERESKNKTRSNRATKETQKKQVKKESVSKDRAGSLKKSRDPLEEGSVASRGREEGALSGSETAPQTIPSTTTPSSPESVARPGSHGETTDSGDDLTSASSRPKESGT